MGKILTNIGDYINEMQNSQIKVVTSVNKFHQLVVSECKYSYSRVQSCFFNVIKITKKHAEDVYFERKIRL